MHKTSYSHLGECLLNMVHRPKNKIAVQFKNRGVWQNKTWNEYLSDINQMSGYLHSLNLQPKDKVAIFSQTRYEWSVVDWAIIGSGFVTVPIYPQSTTNEVAYILNHSEAKVLFIENKSQLKIWDSIKQSCPMIQTVISFDNIEHDLVHTVWIKIFQNNYSVGIHQTCENLQKDDLCTIVYTSGTTGQPKGVMLTHEQAISEISEAFQVCGVHENDISLSFLPYAHVLGRIEHWGHLYFGFCLVYAENQESIRQNLLEIRPTIMVAVPRIFEKIYSIIMTQIQTQSWYKSIFQWSLSVAQQTYHYHKTGQPLPLKILLQNGLAQKAIFRKIQLAFGGRLRFAISGGAPLNTEIAEFFYYAGILILEGYGLSETTAAITVNTPFNFRFGTVGRPIGDVQLKIAEDGEILVKSKKIMVGYYKNPEDTALAFQEGWFRTGDIGEILPSGNLKITDRKKDLIKTAGGKYIAPQKIEALLKKNPLIEHVLVHGDQKKYIVALLTIDIHQAHLILGTSSKNLSTEDLITEKIIQDKVRQIVAETNSQLASYETIKKYLLLPVHFSVEKGELTPSLKVKRKFLDQKFQKELLSLY